MKTDQALQIIKQFIDIAIKNGTGQSLDHITAIAQAWQTILTALKNETKI